MSDTPATQSDFSKASESMTALLQTQEQVDTVIDSLPDTAPEKALLIKQRDDNRGFFTTTILPAWQKIKDYFSGEATTGDPTISGEFDSQVTNYISADGLGFLPLIWGGIVISGLALTAFITYTIESTAKEKAILESGLSLQQKYDVIKGSGVTGLTGMFGEFKGIIIAGVAAVVLLQFLPLLKKGVKTASNPRRRRRYA